MSQKVFTTKFNYSMPTEELVTAMTAAAPAFSSITGCVWKIWLLNEEKKEAGGVYLFESAEALDKFVNGSLFASVANNPGFSNLQSRVSGIEQAASLITRAPLTQTSF